MKMEDHLADFRSTINNQKFYCKIMAGLSFRYSHLNKVPKHVAIDVCYNKEIGAYKSNMRLHVFVYARV